VTTCAVIKANAYGHGVVMCARALEREGARWFGVTSTDEGVQLRDAGIRGQILLMTSFCPGDENEIVSRNLVPTVWEKWQLDRLQRMARSRHISTVKVHVKVDTGLGRQGVRVDDITSMIDNLRLNAALQVDGLSTHLASAEVVGTSEVNAQLTRFRAVTATFRRAFAPRYIHAANSAAIMGSPESWNSMVRPGISLYGYHVPFQGKSQPKILPISPVLSWKTRISSIKHVPAKQALGYNGTFVTKRKSCIGVIPVGYADGLSRQLSSLGRVLVRGAYAPIVGRISMDITLIDITDIPNVEIGNEVVLIGTSGACKIDACEYASMLSTVPHEILTDIASRVPRYYKITSDRSYSG
jgi:alanine racemase